MHLDLRAAAPGRGLPRRRASGAADLGDQPHRRPGGRPRLHARARHRRSPSSLAWVVAALAAGAWRTRTREIWMPASRSRGCAQRVSPALRRGCASRRPGRATSLADAARRACSSCAGHESPTRGRRRPRSCSAARCSRVAVAVLPLLVRRRGRSWRSRLITAAASCRRSTGAFTVAAGDRALHDRLAALLAGRRSRRPARSCSPASPTGSRAAREFSVGDLVGLVLLRVRRRRPLRRSRRAGWTPARARQAGPRAELLASAPSPRSALRIAQELHDVVAHNV